MSELTMTDIATSEFASEPRPSRRLWIIAGLGAIALHLGGAAIAVSHLRAVESDGEFGSAAIEIGIDMTSPHEQPSDLPPGPDRQASVAAPAVPERQAVVKQTELPKATPTETHDADRVVTTEDNSKPRTDETDKPVAQTSASVPSAAQQATAPQRLDETAPESAVARAPDVALGKDQQKRVAQWNAQISGRIQAHLRYPSGEKDRTVKVEVRFVLNRLGQILSLDVPQSSGTRAFDEAAMAAVRRAAPFPRPPADLEDERFEKFLGVGFTPPK